MQGQALIAHLRDHINPAYVNQIGTESWERRLCLDEIERLASALSQTDKIAGDLQVLCDKQAKALAADQATIRDLRDALEMIYDKWENGDPCTDDPESGGILGKCVDLSDEEENQILALIPSVLNGNTCPPPDESLRRYVAGEQEAWREELRAAIILQCTFPGAKRHSGQSLRIFISENPEIYKLCGDWKPDTSLARAVFHSSEKGKA